MLFAVIGYLSLNCEFYNNKKVNKKVAVFYWQGSFDYDKMSLASRLMMKAFVSALKAKKDQSEEEKVMAEMISKSYDISDKKYIQPILEWAEK